MNEIARGGFCSLRAGHSAEMQQRFAARSGRQAAVYRIVVRGELARPLVGPLEEMSVEAEGGETVLTGELVDQAHLRGALSYLHDLGLEIVSVNPADAPD